MSNLEKLLNGVGVEWTVFRNSSFIGIANNVDNPVTTFKGIYKLLTVFTKKWVTHSGSK